MRLIAAVSGLYDALVGVMMLLGRPLFARLFDVPLPVPPIHADLNGLFLLAVAAGYAIPYREPQSAAGRAYLWSASAGKVVCVGDVMAQNSSNISYTAANDSVDAYYGRNDRGEIRAALDQDLRAQVQRAILASFEHAAGPAEARRAPKKAR